MTEIQTLERETKMVHQKQQIHTQLQSEQNHPIVYSTQNLDL
ncbi:phosphate ABC transporter ATP-binding protein, partial [Staphylococcus pseudintermedius]|nr:phosphate ABC transporter ATP-binding protein [Staphylococcus pseudintermedius]